MNLHTIKRVPYAGGFLGILKVRDWASHPHMLVIYGDFYIVGTWHEYPDGVFRHEEGKTTVAMTALESHANLIFEHLLAARV